jgi:hypothetical protein
MRHLARGFFALNEEEFEIQKTSKRKTLLLLSGFLASRLIPFL